MRRLRPFAALVLLAFAIVLPLSSAARANEAVSVVTSDLASYPEVRLVVVPPAQMSEQILADASFRIEEDGTSRPVRVEPLAADQLEVALVIDTSGSMIGAPLAAAKDAARSFLSELPENVPVSIVGFGASPNVVSSRSTDRSSQASAIAGLGAGGETALYDALASALTQLPVEAGSRRALVLLTDGGDTASAARLDATTDALATAKVPLFAVELTTSESNPEALRQLTTASGGAVVPASDPEALTGSFDAIARQLVRQYAVTYSSAAHGDTDLEVVVESQGVRATAHRQLQLPAATSSVTPVGTGGSSSPLGTWALLAGGALCGLAMFGLLLGFFGSRTPRAHGLATPRRGLDLAVVSDRAETLGEALLKRRGGVEGVSGALEAAGMDIRAGELLIGVAAVDLVAAVAGALLIAPLVGLVLAIVVPIVAMVGLRFLAGRRRRRFSDQLAETLQILAGGLRAGHGLAQAVDTVAREAESPTAEEFRRLTIETRLGGDFVEALSSLSARVGSDDLEWVVQAIDIQREVGGDLAEVLDTVASTIRDRTKIRRQVSALSAEGRMSAWVLMVLPFGLGGVLAVTNPEYLKPLFASGTGYALLAVGAALLTVGGLWLRRIVRPIF